MIYLPVFLFAIAAAGGLTLVIMRFSGRGLPWPVVIAHGVFAASGLVALIINVFSDTRNFLMNLALLLFLVAAIGGFTLLNFHLRKEKQPKSLIFIHGAVAIVSYILLIVSIFG